MHDKEKIRIMAKMAVYDKRDFQRDSKANHYFRTDYIYKQNMRMRFFLGIGCAILAFFYVLYVLAIEGADIFALDFQFEALRLLTFVLLVMVGYSFLGTIIYTREFVIAQRRIDKYFALMKELDRRNDARDKQMAGKKGKGAAGRTLAEDDGEEVFEKSEPYRRYGEGENEVIVYRYRSSDDPEFWEDDDKPASKV